MGSAYYEARAHLAGKRQMKSHHHLDKRMHSLRPNLESLQDLNMLTSVRQLSDLLHRHSYKVFKEDNRDHRGTLSYIHDNMSNLTICGTQMTA
jgi:hypothetical protein